MGYRLATPTKSALSSGPSASVKRNLTFNLLEGFEKPKGNEKPPGNEKPARNEKHAGTLEVRSLLISKRRRVIKARRAYCETNRYSEY